MTKNNITIYLIKEGITSFNDIIKDARILKSYDSDTVAYYSPSDERQPKWLKEFFQINNEGLLTSNARAILLKRIEVADEKRIFALTFGYGKTLLKENVYEEQFGLKIVLNTVGINDIRKISKVNVGSNQKQSQEQMPKESDISDFGFDIERDLIKRITGKCDDTAFEGANITGGDTLSIYSDKNITNIENLLRECYVKYKDTAYKQSFEWIDNIKMEKDQNVIDKLNAMVVDKLNNRNFADIWLAIPEVINWEKIKRIYISGQKDRDAEYLDIDNEAFVESFGNSKILHYDQIKGKTISAKSTEDGKTDIVRWSADKCLVGSLELDNAVYAINGGHWYKISHDFAKEINDAYKKIPLCTMDFIDCADRLEKDYNEQLAKSFENGHNLDRTKIPIGGGSGNNFEPCDVAVKKTLIYIKKNEGSSYLSHLFNQAVVACNALKDENSRKKLKDNLCGKHIYDVIDDTFKAEDYTIVLGIINHHVEERPRIPFFSKVVAKYTYQQVTNLGYKFCLKNIRQIQNEKKEN